MQIFYFNSYLMGIGRKSRFTTFVEEVFACLDQNVRDLVETLSLMDAVHLIKIKSKDLADCFRPKIGSTEHTEVFMF